MRRSALQVVLAALVSLQEVSAGSLPRGVGPDFAKHYDSKDTFSCIKNPSIKISSNQVNDNSCDCPDGSDEPGTAACAHIDPLSPPQPLPGSPTGTNATNALPGFWCANAGHVGSYLPFMYVNDGVCDYDLCCDGSDEYAGVGGVKCLNKCAEIGKEWRRIEEEHKASLERSGKARQELVRQAKMAKRNVETRIVNLKNDITNLEVKKKDLQRKLEETERKERNRVVKGPKRGGGLGVLKELAKNRVDELRDALEVVVNQRDEIKDTVYDLERILASLKEEYNPNYNDAGVKAAVKAWEDHLSNKENAPSPELTDSELLGMMVADDENNGINWAEFEEEEEPDTAILYKLEAYLPYPLKQLIYSKMDDLKSWLVSAGILADGPKQGETKAVTDARNAVKSAEGELSSKQSQLKNEEDDLAKDYGPDDIFRALKDKCITKDAGEYTYELCWAGKTTQKSKKGHGNVAMGEFSRIDREMSDEEERHDGKGLGTGERMVLRYEDGQSCWNGPRRKTDVWLACAEKEELWRVSESEKCVYKMEVGTPAACEQVAEVKPVGKDEL